jgi:hypothetical protein
MLDSDWSIYLLASRHCLSHVASLFFCDSFSFYKIGCPKLFALGKLWTAILQISASWEGRITGLSHRHLAVSCLEEYCGLNGMYLKTLWLFCLTYAKLIECIFWFLCWLFQDKLFIVSKTFSLSVWGFCFVLVFCSTGIAKQAVLLELPLYSIFLWLFWRIFCIPWAGLKPGSFQSLTGMSHWCPDTPSFCWLRWGSVKLFA